LGRKGGSKWEARGFSIKEFKEVMSRWQRELEGRGWNSLFLSNHDMPRQVSKFGDDKKYRTESAKALAAMLHTMQGTPFVYQGEELGMTNVKFDKLNDYKDAEIFNMAADYMQNKGFSEEELLPMIYREGRDNARTPMQWSVAQNGGFTSGEPWIKLNPNYTKINVASQQKDPDSVLNFYKKLIALRKEYDIIALGNNFTEYFEDHPNIYAYTREYEGDTLLSVINFSKEAFEVDFPKQ
jgi:oligo-1,6-glucosidase